MDERSRGEDEGDHHDRDCDERGVPLPEATAEKAVDACSEEREEDDGPEIRLRDTGRSEDGGHKSGAKDYPLVCFETRSNEAKSLRENRTCRLQIARPILRRKRASSPRPTCCSLRRTGPGGSR